MEQTWDDRYANPEFIYGVEPNRYFENKLNTIYPKGRLLLPAEGEGRNAIYASLSGWNVTAFDSSVVAKHKALHLALEKNVKIDYHTYSVENATFEPMSFDAIALIYTHFPEDIRSLFFKRIISWLKPGGHLILECFDKLQLKNTTGGGPKVEELLYTIDMIKNDFKTLQIIELVQEQIILDEGFLHQGAAEVIRLFAKR